MVDIGLVGWDEIVIRVAILSETASKLTRKGHRR